MTSLLAGAADLGAMDRLWSVGGVRKNTYLVVNDRGQLSRNKI